MAWSGPALKILTSADSPIPIEKNDIPWLTFSATLGDAISIIVCGLFFQNVGRKTLTLICALFLVLSWLLTTMATTFDMLIVSKFLVNAAISINDVSNCFYISEVVSTENRGVFVALVVLFFTLGIESEYLIGLFENYYYLNMLPLIVSLITVFLVFYAIESPYYLLTKNDTAEAWKSLSTLNGDGDFQRIARDYDDLVHFVRDESVQGSNLKCLLTRQNYKMCLCGVAVYGIAYMNSAFLFFSYIPVVFDQFQNVLNFEVIMNLVGVVNIVGVVLSTLIIEKFDRRTLLLLSFPCTALLHFIIASGFYMDDYYGSGGILPACIVIAALVDVAFFVVISCPVSHVLRSEVLPPKMRITGTCVMELLKSIIQGTVISLFIPIASAFGMGFNFIIYGVFAWFGAYFVHKYLIETRGKTLIEIRNDYAQL